MPPEGKSPCPKGVGEPPNGQNPNSSPRLSAIQIPYAPDSSFLSVPSISATSGKSSKKQKHGKRKTTQKQVSFSLAPDQAISVVKNRVPSITHDSPFYHTFRVLWDSGARGSKTLRAFNVKVDVWQQRQVAKGSTSLEKFWSINTPKTHMKGHTSLSIESFGTDSRLHYGNGLYSYHVSR